MKYEQRWWKIIQKFKIEQQPYLNLKDILIQKHVQIKQQSKQESSDKGEIVFVDFVGPSPRSSRLNHPIVFIDTITKADVTRYTIKTTLNVAKQYYSPKMNKLKKKLT